MLNDWRNIRDFPGYQINSDGQVRSFKNPNGSGLRVKSVIIVAAYGGIVGSRYLYVLLYRDHKQHKKALHRILWETFNGDIPEDLTIDHIDRNKSNNQLDNLRLSTRRQNAWNQQKRKGRNK